MRTAPHGRRWQRPRPRAASHGLSPTAEVVPTEDMSLLALTAAAQRRTDKSVRDVRALAIQQTSMQRAWAFHRRRS